MKEHDLQYCLMTAVMCDNFKPFQKYFSTKGKMPLQRREKVERIVYDMVINNTQMLDCVRRRAEERLAKFNSNPYFVNK